MNPEYIFSRRRIPPDTGASIRSENCKVDVMKSSVKIKSVTMAILIALVNYLCGCSVVGLGVGALIDKSRPDYTTVEPDKILDLGPGTKMTLFMEDGSYEYGKVAGTTSKIPGERTPDNIDSIMTFDQRMLIFESIVYPDTDRHAQYLPLRSVGYARVHNSKNAKYVGLVIGLFFDIMAASSVHIGPFPFKEAGE